MAANWCRHKCVVHKFRQENSHDGIASESPADEFEFRETQNMVINALANLPNHQRIVFIMNRFEGLTYTQIADRMNISPKTVESHMVKALKILRNSILAEA
jgi:RNA polymerase sigma-70 factor (ECF subfamily)